MAAIISLFLIVTLSILVTRIASLALTHTGLSMQAARFQARSAFTGVGFTTSESEQVINHPLRRRIILSLMLLGNAGIVTSITSLILTFITPGEEGLWNVKILILIGGLAVLWYASVSKWVDKHLSRVINAALNKYTDLDVKDYASILHLAEHYRVSRINVESGDWVTDTPLRELELHNEGILVLGIQRKNGDYLGAPTGDSVIKPEDTLILYGKRSTLEEIDERKKGLLGDQAHERAVEKQERVQEAEESRDKQQQEQREKDKTADA